MEKAKKLIFYIYMEGVKHYVCIFDDVEYKLENSMQVLILYKNKEFIGVFSLSNLKMEVEE